MVSTMNYALCTVIFNLIVFTSSEYTSLLMAKSTPEFVSGLLRTLKWNYVAFVYDDDVEFSETYVDKVLDLLNDQSIRTVVYKISFSSVKDMLIQIHSSNFPKIQMLYMTSEDPDRVTATMRIVNDFDFYSKRMTDFRVKSKWILITYSHVFESVGKVLNDLCHVAVIMQLPSGCFDARTLEKNTNQNSFKKVLQISDERDIFPNLRYGLNGRKIIIGSAPYEQIKRKIVNGKYVYYGWMIDVLNDIALALNFTYVLQEPKDGRWGVKTGNNTWDGLIGELQRHEIDILYAEYIITKQRSEVMDFILPPLRTSSLSVVYDKRNLYESFSWVSFFKPFSNKVYAAISLAFVTFSVFFLLVESVHLENQNLCHVFFNIFGCLFLEGGHIHPRSSYGRILYISWWIFCVIVTSVYTGQLTSVLLIKENEKPFTDLREMAQQTQWTYGTVKDSAIQDIFAKSKLEENIAVWKNIVEFNKTDPGVLAATLDELYDKVWTSKFALITTLGRELSCNLSAVKMALGGQHMSFAVSYNSPLKEDLKWAVQELEKTGIIEHIYQSNAKNFKDCTKKEEATSKAITLNHMKGLFAAIGIGIFIAFICLLFEYVYEYVKRQTNLCIAQFPKVIL